jgi:hypothetical protein
MSEQRPQPAHDSARRTGAIFQGEKKSKFRSSILAAAFVILIN